MNIVYIDVDIAYGSPTYGNVQLYQKSMAPAGLRNVTYVHEIDGDRLKKMVKHALQYPKNCEELQRSQ